jgi:hypothetical protein
MLCRIQMLLEWNKFEYDCEFNVWKEVEIMKAKLRHPARDATKSFYRIWRSQNRDYEEFYLPGYNTV